MHNLFTSPEVQSLIGVPQPTKWHPEGDAYIHTVLVWEQAKQRYPGNKVVEAAAICHDLGKALTKDHWPNHYGHAALGIKPTYDLLIRAGLKDIVVSVGLITKYHMHIHTADVMKTSTYQKIYRDLLNYINPRWIPTWVDDLCALGVCDHYGRGRVNQNEVYDKPQIFKHYMDLVIKNWS